MATGIVRIHMPDISRKDIVERGMIAFDGEENTYYLEVDPELLRKSRQGKIYLPMTMIIDGSETLTEDTDGSLIVEDNQIIKGRVKKRFIRRIRLN